MKTKNENIHFDALTDGNRLDAAITRIRVISDLLSALNNIDNIEHRTIPESARVIHQSVGEIEELWNVLIGDWHNLSSETLRFKGFEHSQQFDAAIMRIRVISDLMTAIDGRPDLADSTIPESAYVIYNSVREIDELYQILVEEWRVLQGLQPFDSATEKAA